MSDNSQQAENLRQAMRDAGVQTPELVPDQEVEIVCNGTVHYRRPIHHPMVMEALRTPGYSVRNPWIAETIDKAKLWDDFKALLEIEAQGKAESQSLDQKTIGGFGPTRARAVLDRMEQEETFARVRAGFGKIDGGQS